MVSFVFNEFDITGMLTMWGMLFIEKNNFKQFILKINQEMKK